MHIEDENDDRESASINGGDLTEEEARLFAKGVDAPDDDSDGADDDADADDEESSDAEDDADAEEEDDDGPDTETAEEAEARRQQEEEQHQADEVAVPPIQQRAAVPDKPAAPKDFDAEIARLEQQYQDNEIDAVELNRKTRELTLEQTRYERQIDDWQRQQDEAKAKADDDWNSTAKAWEGEHKAFMENPLRAERMQNALNLLIKSGEQMSNRQLLDRAYRYAAEDAGWKEPTKQADPKEKEKEREAVGKALKDRKQDKPGKTLGDVPAAALDTATNTEFEALDDLPIDELEDVVGNMKPGTLDKFLRSAEGANATGREIPRRKTRA
jgi:hypothetical protein